MELADIITDPELGGTTFEYGRITESVNSKGRAEYSETRHVAEGNIQPAPGKERELLPEADRGRATIVVFTPATLQAGIPGTADRIYYKGNAYRVSLAEEWAEHAGFTKVLAVLEITDAN